VKGGTKKKRTIVFVGRSKLPRLVPPEMESIAQNPQSYDQPPLISPYLRAKSKLKKQLTWPPTTPKPRRVIVARTHENVAQRMVCEGPNVRIVRVLQHVLWRRVWHAPMDDGAFGTARDEEVVVDWVPGDCYESRGELEIRRVKKEESARTANLLLVPAKRDELLHRADVEHLDELIARSGRDEVTVGTPGGGLDRVLVTVSTLGEGVRMIRRSLCAEGDEAYNVVRTLDVRGSQNLIRLSLLPETSNPFVGCHLTHFTSHP
jgi:hypothetical protein